MQLIIRKVRTKGDCYSQRLTGVAVMRKSIILLNKLIKNPNFVPPQ